MNFYGIGNFFLLYLLFISLFNNSNQNEAKKWERLENTIKLMLSSMKGHLKQNSFSFGYKKYNIILQNFKILEPLFFKDIIIQEENLDNIKYIKVNNVKITFIMDINIKLFSNPNRLIKDEEFFIETTFNEILFHLINDYNIEIISSNIIYINIVQNNIMSDLDFFKDFNNKKNYLFNEESKEEKISLKDALNKLFIERLKEVDKNINLLTYDMFFIFNKYAEFNNDESDEINNIKIDKIVSKDNYFKVNNMENSIKLSNVTIFGNYLFYGFYEVNFNISCKDNNDHIIYKKSEQNKYVEINIDDCILNDDNIIDDAFEIEEDIIHILKKDYANYLNQNADNYYKKYLEL